jgi:hypothetical protein
MPEQKEKLERLDLKDPWELQVHQGDRVYKAYQARMVQ